ncbi:MAG: hypothetical protein HQK76_16175 [Desulfobacterales bacterium]|nr:hypothetical protein [Desulfobacterales bacterium]
MDYLSEYLKKLEELFKKIDDKYKLIADFYGFTCENCLRNCCLTHFYHHTHIEYYYLISGFKNLSYEKQAEIKERAIEYCELSDESQKSGEKLEKICPLNFDNLCILYSYRPMICRLHGIPHELAWKGMGKNILSPGCESFSYKYSDDNYIKFDRTPFYGEMANIEKIFKHFLNIEGKFKMTVAQMLV